MQRFHQLLFIVSLLALSWLTMLASHEVGHVLGAIVTGGSVERVVLHPLKTPRMAYTAVSVLITLVVVELVFSPR